MSPLLRDNTLWLDAKPDNPQVKGNVCLPAYQITTLELFHVVRI
jgi:hypothetical protein